MRLLNANLGSGQTSNVIEVEGTHSKDIAILFRGTFNGEAYTVQLAPRAADDFEDLTVDQDAGPLQFTDARLQQLHITGACRLRFVGDGGGTPSGVSIFIDGNGVDL